MGHTFALARKEIIVVVPAIRIVKHASGGYFRIGQNTVEFSSELCIRDVVANVVVFLLLALLAVVAVTVSACGSGGGGSGGLPGYASACGRRRRGRGGRRRGCRHRGDWQGLTRTEYAERWAHERVNYWDAPLTWRAHGGESEEELVARAWPALVEAAEMAQGAVGVLTAHRQVIRGLTAAAIGVAPGASHRMQLDPAHGVLLRDAVGGWILERTNAPAPGSPHAAEPPDGPPEDVVTQLR